MSMDDTQQRRFERADFRVAGFISVDGQDLPFRVVNISLKGILVSPKDDSLALKAGVYPLRVSLPNSDISIRTLSRLVHSKDGSYGFAFESVEADGMIHLRRLLELNISSEYEIEKELSFLKDD